MRARVAVFTIACAIAASAFAQSPAMKPFEINMDRVRVSTFGGNFGGTDTYLIPTLRLRLSVQGSVWAQKGGAKTHGKYYVIGADHDVMQDLATKLQNDLVTKMRAAGYKVLTYDDVKSEPDVAGQSLNKVDARYGFPTSGGLGMPVTFIDVTPTDAQAWSSPAAGPAWPFRGLAKAKNVTVIIPELTFTTPQMFAKTEHGWLEDKAGISMDPTMIFEGAMVVGLTPKGGGPAIQVQQHGKRTASDAPGKIIKANEYKMHVQHVEDFSSADFVMDLDKDAFSDGILRVGFALNDVIVAQVKKDHR